jgi:hypothetical protein
VFMALFPVFPNEAANPLIDKISALMDTTFARWTIGRIDSALSLVITTGALALQSLKLVAKLFAVVVTFDTFKFVEGRENWSSLGLKLDGYEWTRIALRDWETVKDIARAPPKGYQSTPTKAAELFETVIGGISHDEIFAKENKLLNTPYQNALTTFNKVVKNAESTIELIIDAKRAVIDAKRVVIDAERIVEDAGKPIRAALAAKKSAVTSQSPSKGATEWQIKAGTLLEKVKDLLKNTMTVNELNEAATKLDQAAGQLSDAAKENNIDDKFVQAVIKLVRAKAMLARANAKQVNAETQRVSLVNNCTAVINAVDTKENQTLKNLKKLLTAVKDGIDTKHKADRPALFYTFGAIPEMKLTIQKLQNALTTAYGNARIDNFINSNNHRHPKDYNNIATFDRTVYKPSIEGSNPYDTSAEHPTSTGNDNQSGPKEEVGTSEGLKTGIPDHINEIREIPQPVLEYLRNPANSLLATDENLLEDHVSFNQKLKFPPIPKAVWIRLMQNSLSATTKAVSTSNRTSPEMTQKTGQATNGIK